MEQDARGRETLRADRPDFELGAWTASRTGRATGLGTGSDIGNGADADLELIAASYETAVRARTWRDLLSGFCDRFEASAGALCSHDFVTGRGTLFRDFNIPPALRETYNAGLFGENPWLESSSSYRLLSASTGDEICSADRLVESEFYGKFLAPQGLFHRLCGVVSNQGDRIQYISLLRQRGERPFDLEDKTALCHLLPFVGRSLTLRSKLQRGRREWSDLRGLLAHLPLACLLVDRSARLQFHNPAAEQLLEGASGLGTRSGRVIAGSKQDSERLHRLIHSIAAGDRAGEHLVLPRASGPLPLLCVLFPLAWSAGEEPEPGRQTVALLVKDLQDESQSSAEDFADAFGLTKAEARLVALLGEGYALFEAATRLGITKSTARTHMRNIYGKVGANRQTDIVRLLERFNLF